MITTAAVFMSGNSQAVRLPKAFQLNCTRVLIERRGDEIVLREKKDTVADILKTLPPISEDARQAWDELASDLHDSPPQVRDWETLLGEPNHETR